MLKNKYLSLFLHGFFLTSYSKSVNKGQVQCLAVWGRNATSWGQSELSSRLIWTTKWNCLNVSWMPSPFRKKYKKTKLWSREIPQWLKVLTALSEDPSLLPRTHKWLTTTYTANNRGPDALFWPSQALVFIGTYPHTGRHAFTLIKIFF